GSPAVPPPMTTAEGPAGEGPAGEDSAEQEGTDEEGTDEERAAAVIAVPWRPGPPGPCVRRMSALGRRTLATASRTLA
ncbi:hypothetical protein, partial [Streptomyces clavuligerus]|uniref:hypothetical protein n=2 Tax=Streptomyces clavuligerus TaxID=1901 RepID=UPI001E4F5807